MRNIETEIETLKAQIARLEKQQRDGYFVEDGYYESYFIEPQHEILRDTRGEILAVIVDEAAVRKYIADKDNLASSVAA